MSMICIDLIAGARPNFMKIARIIDALKVAQARGSHLGYRLIHTGQHYDRSMSGGFFEQPCLVITLSVALCSLLLRQNSVDQEEALHDHDSAGQIPISLRRTTTTLKAHTPSILTSPIDGSVV